MNAPVVVPRWEWRTFGGLEDVEGDELLAGLWVEAPDESDETYLLSWRGDASVKVRDGVLDTKVLHRVDGAGLQLWVPVMKAAFPLDGESVATAYDALAATAPSGPVGDLGLDGLLADVDGPREDLRSVAVHKVRRRAVRDVMLELTDLTAGGTTVRTLVVEGPDPALVTETVRRLGLEERPNVCVARGLKTMLGWSPATYAVVDVGTNSVKFTLGHRSDDGALRTDLDTAVVTRLGEGLAEAGELTEAAMSRTVDALAGLVDDARAGGPVDIVAVGTAGLRQAPNRDAFVDTVHSRSGVTVEVISGREEARLAYLAAVSTLAVTGDRLLVFDSGGGSSQFTFGTRDRIEDQFSVDVGAVRFTERFGLDQAVSRETVDDALAAIADDLGALTGRPRPDHVIAIGGTSTNLAAVTHGLSRYDPDVVHGTVLDLAEVDRHIETFRLRSADDRREIPGLQPARAEVILAGACIVRTILTLSGQDAVTVSDRGLRHGVAVERFGSRVQG